ncbi:MAG: cation:dicarboxylate symporter family transporter, partial [Gammaproteobacteria bacterium]
MGWGKLLLLLLLLNVTAKGIPAIPRGSLLVLASTIAPLGIPLEGIAVLLALDQIPDMARTAMNLTGNCLACAVVDKWEASPASS